MNSAESLKGFLSRIEAQLGDLPEARRAEILAEARNHLEAMLAANRADGLGDAAAWEKTAQGFGDAGDIGRDLDREWKRAPRVETMGTPLSKREKALKFARPLLLVLVGYPLLLTLLIWLEKYHLAGALVMLLSLCASFFQIWRLRKRRIPFTPSTTLSWVLCCSVPFVVGLQMQFGDELRGTSLETVFNNWFGPVMIVIFLLTSIWAKREANKTLPWRYLPSYAKNPIGAEEEYRLSPLIGLAMGTTMGCIGTIWMGMQFFGFQIAALMCLFDIVFALIYARFVVGKSR